MPVITTITWDPELKFEEAPIHCESVVMVEEDGELKEHPFSMDLDFGLKLRAYLNAVRSRGYGAASLAGWRIQEKVPGKEVYTITSDDKLFLSSVNRLHKITYIITRNEEVNHERYCAFYGNSGDWDTRLCNYDKGSRAERFLQTLYDMVHSYPTIHKWTNSAIPFVAALEQDPGLKEHYDQKIIPLLRRLGPESPSELENLVAELKDIPVVAQYDLASLGNNK